MPIISSYTCDSIIYTPRQLWCKILATMSFVFQRIYMYFSQTLCYFVIFEQPYGGICFSTVWKVGVLLLWIMDDICLCERFESWLKSSTALLNTYHRPKAQSDCFAFVTYWLLILYRDKGF